MSGTPAVPEGPDTKPLSSHHHLTKGTVTYDQREVRPSLQSHHVAHTLASPRHHRLIVFRFFSRLGRTIDGLDPEPASQL